MIPPTFSPTYLDWYLDNGVDFIVALDYGSIDGSIDILNSYQSAGALHWRPNPSHDYLRHNPFDAVATVAREEFGADWVIVCDTDEFLTTDNLSLSAALAEASEKDFAVISVPSFNMTGPFLTLGSRAAQQLTLRVDRPVEPAVDQFLSDDLPTPCIFIHQAPKTIVRAKTLIGYDPGSHGAKYSSGQAGTIPGIRFLHYQMRDYGNFERKVRNTARWLRENSELGQSFGWHWRRWIRLYEAGELCAEHARQFVSAERAQELVADGTCSYDNRIASWIGASSSA
jgi:hypothetical protein